MSMNTILQFALVFRKKLRISIFISFSLTNLLCKFTVENLLYYCVNPNLHQLLIVEPLTLRFKMPEILSWPGQLHLSFRLNVIVGSRQYIDGVDFRNRDLTKVQEPSFISSKI